MQFFILTILLSLIAFLFCLYILTHDDLLLLRKNISPEKVFNIGFLAILVSFLSARFIFVLFNFSPLFFNPLAFLLFVYFPGLSLIGGVLGGILFVVIYTKVNKLPKERFMDFFSISFLFAYIVGLVTTFLTLIFLRQALSIFQIIALIVYIGLLILVSKIYQKRGLAEGSITYLILIIFSIVSFIEQLTTSYIVKVYSVITKEDFLLIIIFLASIILLVKQEKLLNKIKK